MNLGELNLRIAPICGAFGVGGALLGSRHISQSPILATTLYGLAFGITTYFITLGIWAQVMTLGEKAPFKRSLLLSRTAFILTLITGLVYGLSPLLSGWGAYHLIPRFLL